SCVQNEIECEPTMSICQPVASRAYGEVGCAPKQPVPASLPSQRLRPAAACQVVTGVVLLYSVIVPCDGAAVVLAEFATRAPRGSLNWYSTSSAPRVLFVAPSTRTASTTVIESTFAPFVTVSVTSYTPPAV